MPKDSHMVFVKVEYWELDKENSPVFLEFTLSWLYVALCLRLTFLLCTHTNPLCVLHAIDLALTPGNLMNE